MEDRFLLAHIFSKSALMMGGAAFLTLLAADRPARAFTTTLTTFFGEDLNDSAFIPLTDTPNADAAQADFLSNLEGVGPGDAEDFEGFADGTLAPLDLSFPNPSGGSITATLSGGGVIDSVAPGQTDGEGRYATSGSNFFEVVAGGSGNFAISFSEGVAAFGFSGVDISDFGGQLELELSNGATEQITLPLPNTIGFNGSTDGSAIFFGLLAESAEEEFLSISFLTESNATDIFAFDDLIVATSEQVQDDDGEAIPEPATILGALVAVAAGRFLKSR